MECYTQEDAKYAAEFYSNPDNPRMPDHEIIINNGRVEPYYTNRAEYSYEDLIDADKQLKNSEIKNEDIQYCEPFWIASGLRLNKSFAKLYDENDSLNVDLLQSLNEDELTSLIDSATQSIDGDVK